VNDEERLIWGKYLSVVATSRRQELEALDELLNEIGKPILGEEQPKNFDSLVYVVKTGGKGDYEQARYEDQQDKDTFKALQEILKKHNGFWQNSTHKFWFHSKDESLIDRRKK